MCDSQQQQRAAWRSLTRTAVTAVSLSACACYTPSHWYSSHSVIHHHTGTHLTVLYTITLVLISQLTMLYTITLDSSHSVIHHHTGTSTLTGTTLFVLSFSFEFMALSLILDLSEACPNQSI